MKVEKVPDSTYDMIGGLDQQIKEIKEVCSLCIVFLLLGFLAMFYFLNYQHCWLLIGCVL